jgi:hypothetical protein
MLIWGVKTEAAKKRGSTEKSCQQGGYNRFSSQKFIEKESHDLGYMEMEVASAESALGYRKTSNAVARRNSRYALSRASNHDWPTERRRGRRMGSAVGSPRRGRGWGGGGLVLEVGEATRHRDGQGYRGRSPDRCAGRGEGGGRGRQ